MSLISDFRRETKFQDPNDYNPTALRHPSSWIQNDPDSFTRTKRDRNGSVSTTSYRVGSFLQKGCEGTVFNLMPSDPMRKVKVIKYFTQQYEFQHSTEGSTSREKTALDRLKRSCPSFAGYVKSTDIPNAIIFRKLDSTLLQTLASLSFWEKISTFEQLNKQLDELHQAGILHGDIHLGNIMHRKKDNQFYFIDFGYSVLGKKNMTEFDAACSAEKISFMTLTSTLLKDHLEDENLSDIDERMLEAAKKYDPTFRIDQTFKDWLDQSAAQQVLSDSDEKSLMGPDSPSTPCCCQIFQRKGFTCQ